MAEVTVSEFAKVLKVPVDRLMISSTRPALRLRAPAT